ncbi:hypothetical protein STAQ_20180 [Allostella sp. ATCC 35155]|nr:hypothetical protein STAQ_20180 [Stella sp. ATCC 35155]
MPVDNPDLLKAQGNALSRLIPLMYFILAANVWVLATAFAGKAPDWLTIHAAFVLTAVCIVRLGTWWRTRVSAMEPVRIVREFRRTNVMAAVMSVAVLLWGIALFPYGSPLEQSHVAFFATISMICTICCLIHIRTAALLVAGIGVVGFVGFFASTGVPTFEAMAVNVLLVTAAVTAVVMIQSRDFDRMVDAQARARRTHREQGRLLRMLDDMPVAVMTVDPVTFRIDYVNETSRRTLGRIEHLLPIKVADILGTCIDVFHPHPEHQRRLLSDPDNLPHTTRIRLGPEMLELQVSAVRGDDGSFLGPMLSWAIVTREVESEERIRRLAHHDTLTGLPNRTMFRERLEARLAVPDGRSALLFVDLDGFKLVNDSRGHHVGDTLLQQVAGRLMALCTAPGMTVGRLGGDEFAILAPDADADRAAALAGTIVAALSEPYRGRHDSILRIGASVGIALAPLHGDDAAALLARADIALFAAKAAGKRTFRLFSADMETRIRERVHLEAELRCALDRSDGLFVFYQPIVEVATGRVTAREALARWHHPTRGWITPDEFIPVAEDSGLIDALGTFVLHRACGEAAGWDDGVRVAVNVSASQLGKATLVPAVVSALAASGLPANRLEVEVTETVLLGDRADVIDDLQRLRELGLRVALDDFGTGYSSLAHLRSFAFDKIKIDGSFVRDAQFRPDCAAVVRAVAELGQRLGMTTVAEGVETEAQRDQMAAKGCTEVQGFFCGRPQPSARDAPLIDARVLSRRTARTD